MSALPEAVSVRVPRHLYVVGVIAVLWNAIGAFDYVMTQTRNATYMGAFTPEQLEYFYSFPAWMVAAWALAVWGGVAGGVLLLMRRRLAVPVFLVSMVAMVLTTIYSYLLSNGMEMFGSAAGHAFNALIFGVGVALYVYALKMKARGVLR
jgi:hypothetical protein